MAELYSLTETSGLSVKVDLTHVGNYIFTQQWDAGTTIGVVSLYLNPWNINIYGDFRVALRLLRGVTEISRVILSCENWSLGNQWIDFDFGGVVLNTKAAYSFQLVSYGALNAYWNCQTGNPKTVGYTLGYDSRYMSVLVQQFDGWDSCLLVNGTAPGPQKPMNPYPANGATQVDFSSFSLSWTNGGGATKYDVYTGSGPGSLTLRSSQQAGTVYTTNINEVPTDQVIYWRVDARDDLGNVATGDVWSFDPRPAQAVLVAPANEAIDQRLHIAADWNAAAVAESYTFRIIEEDGLLPTVIAGLTETDLADIDSYLHLHHDTKYYWRVDTVNQFGTAEGDTWWFRTDKLHTILPPWELLPGHTQGPENDPPGVPGVDFRWLGTNSMITTKRLVAAAMNRFWYEDV